MLWSGMALLLCVRASAGGSAPTAAAVYERLLIDRNASCSQLFPAAEQEAVCQQTRDCLGYFSRQLDYATFKSLCDAIRKRGAGEEGGDPRGGEDKRPGPAEVRSHNLCAAVYIISYYILNERKFCYSLFENFYLIIVNF